MLDHADHHLGRLFAALDELGIRDNTLIMVVSDNGASQEGLQDGVTNTDRYRNFNPETVEEMAKLLDKIGGPETDPLYPMGWSLAGNTPFKKWKQDTHLGGNTDPFIVSWPARIKDAGAIRAQYHHLVDVVPTLLEATGLPAPTSVNGVAADAAARASAWPTPSPTATAKTRKKVQYYEMLGSRAIWADGWTAVAWHKKDTPWEDDKWELYHTDVDFTQYDDLAAPEPGEAEGADRALGGAKRRRTTSCRSTTAATSVRPIPAARSRRCRRTSYTFYPGTSILHPLAAPAAAGPGAHRSRPMWTSPRRGRGRAGRLRRGVRRVEPVPQGRQAPLRPQLSEDQGIRRRRPPSRSRRASTRSACASSRPARP